MMTNTCELKVDDLKRKRAEADEAAAAGETDEDFKRRWGQIVIDYLRDQRQQAEAIATFHEELQYDMDQFYEEQLRSVAAFRGYRQADIKRVSENKDKMMAIFGMASYNQMKHKTISHFRQEQKLDIHAFQEAHQSAIHDFYEELIVQDSDRFEKEEDQQLDKINKFCKERRYEIKAVCDLYQAKFKTICQQQNSLIEDEYDEEDDDDDDDDEDEDVGQDGQTEYEADAENEPELEQEQEQVQQRAATMEVIDLTNDEEIYLI